MHSLPLIEARGVSRRFTTARGESTTVLDDVTLDVDRGDYVALTGPSGSGKSTLLSCLTGLDQASSGSVRLLGRDLAALDDRALAGLRREALGFVFQRTDLLDELDVRDNVLLPAYRAHGRVSTETAARVARLMDRLDIADLARRRPSELSGGQRQRVGICRALVNEPELLVADEPTGALHRESVDVVLDLFDELHAAGTTILVVTHDPVVAGRARTRHHLVDGRMLT